MLHVHNLKKVIALITTIVVTIPIINVYMPYTRYISNEIVAYADEAEDDESSEESEEDVESLKKDTDTDWVYKKDDWRHGIVDESPSEEGGAAKGSASGKYAVKYKDGSYFWYHQSGACSRKSGSICDSCGDWSLMTWGKPGNWDSFFVYACEIYAISAITSNLTGEEITPHVFLEDMGAKYSGTSGNGGKDLKCDTSTCVAGTLDGPLLNDPTKISDFVSSKYGLKSTGSIKSASGGDSAKAKKIVDETLDNGGMIWYVHSMISASHYVAIRYKEGDKYYLLDSCCAPEDSNFDHGYSWDEIWGKKKGDWDYMFGFTNPNPPTGNGDGNTGDGSKPGNMDNKGWQRDHSKDKKITPGMSGVERLNCANLGAPATSYGCELSQPGQGGAPKSWGSEGDVYKFEINDRDKKILEEFAKEHFQSGWSAGQKVEYTLNWINKNVAYADGVHGPSYNTVWGETNVYNIFKLKKGQCLQYNGALAAMMCYLGFDAKEVMGYRGTTGNHWQHFWAEVKIGNEVYVMETGNYGCDGDWKYLCLTYAETVNGGSSHYLKYGKEM